MLPVLWPAIACSINYWFFFVLLFYTIVIVFQLYHGGDMMHEMRRRKPEPTLIPTQGTFNVPHHIDMGWEELAFDNAVSYT